ncbi:MAG TPA: bifunctional pyr operon transcriptional regulator/uracil phosphoribosyltransferase PyrR [Myxococcota bacterium]|nr:bifunctional pyr operon transcriptional regulator/uracil phosphoribosyltransferase PyrR [Myxococcota bacterium]
MPTEWGPAEVQQALHRLADSIAQACTDRPWALVGIRKGGVELADRLQACVAGSRRPARGNVDITLYRDDLYTGLEKPVLGDTDLPFSVDGCDIVLVDDVLYTGRTVRAAMDEILDYGRPARIRLAVLVDRGHRELPIAADHVGLRLETAQADRVEVVLGAKNRTEEDHIWLKRR